MSKSPRELAARALCRKAGHPENTLFQGKPMWMSFLDDVDTVLTAIHVDMTLQAIGARVNMSPEELWERHQPIPVRGFVE